VTSGLWKGLTGGGTKVSCRTSLKGLRSHTVVLKNEKKKLSMSKAARQAVSKSEGMNKP